MEYGQEVKDAAIKALLSGGISGGILGAGTRLFSGSRAATGKDLLKAAAIGSGLAGGIAGGSTLLGSTVMGPPAPDDPGAYTKRAGVGGALAGGVGGALLGALGASGKMPMPKKLPLFMKNYLESLKASPRAALKGAGIGAVVGGVPASAYAADEGMQLDFVNNEIKEQKKKKLREAYALITGETHG